VTSILANISNAALNDRRRSADRIAYELGQQPNYYAYRPSLLELTNERRARNGQAPIIDKTTDALLPPGGTEQLHDMVRKYRRKAKRGKRGDK